MTNQAGMREIIRQEWNIEFAFRGRRFWNLRRWLIAAEELNSSLLGWNILGKDADSFYNNYAGPVVVWSQRKFVAREIICSHWRARSYDFRLCTESELVIIINDKEYGKEIYICSVDGLYILLLQG
ncbi:MAG: RagB/SusD family nutrient uptake outer membrane protein [Butyricimonas faecihominis]